MVKPRVWGDGDPEGVRQRAAEEMKTTARAAAAFGVDTVIGFTGSSIWHYLAMFPPVGDDVIRAGYADFADRWNPIIDVFDAVGVRYAHEVHPSEIAYDYWSTKATLEAIGHRPGFGLNYDPSHMVWQGLDYVGFLLEFRDRIYHVDCKDTKLRMGNGRNGILSSHLPWADPASRVGLHLHRPRRHEVGGHLPDAQLHRLRRAHLHRVGGRRHGPPRRRPRGAGVHPAAERHHRRRVRLRRRLRDQGVSTGPAGSKGSSPLLGTRAPVCSCARGGVQGVVPLAGNARARVILCARRGSKGVVPLASNYAT